MLGSGPPMSPMVSSMYGKPDERPRSIDWRRVLGLLAPYRLQTTAVILCLVLGASLGLLPAVAARYIVDLGLNQVRLDAVLEGVGAMAIAAGLCTALAVCQTRLSTIVAERVLLDLRHDLLKGLYRAPLTFFLDKRSGEIVNRVYTDTNGVGILIATTMTSIVTNVLVMGTSAIAMVLLDWRLSIVALAALPMMVLPLGVLGRRLHSVRRETLAKRDLIHSFMSETLSLSGIALIKAFGRQRLELETAQGIGTDLMASEVRFETSGRWFTASVGALAILGPAAVWLAGGVLHERGSVTVGTVIAFVALLGRIYAPATALATVQVQFIGAMAIFERLFEYLDVTPEGDGGTEIAQADVRGHISFRDVEFAYPGQSDPALHGISFDIRPGDFIGIIGPSGSGKTTITHLLLRLFDPDAGVIRFDGISLRDLDVEEYRAQVGIVQQETPLCYDTIANNIRYGRMTASLDEVIAAAKAADVHDTILRFPGGYDCIVGERGHRMSVGERQRVAIARALLRDPKVLILDEATSNLDSVSERAVQSALQRLMAHRTSIVVAHRLSTIVEADMILVVEHGKIVESGTHEELLRRNGCYAVLYRAQGAAAVTRVSASA